MGDQHFSVNTNLAFDLGKQAAILGWCLRDKLFCTQCTQAVQASWFASAYTNKLYAGLVEMMGAFHRIPTPEELINHRPFLQEDARSQRLYKEALDNAIKQTETYSLEVLRGEMTAWIRAVIFAQAVPQAVTSYNAKKVDEAWQTLEEATLLKVTASFEDGINQGFRPSSERIFDERAERLADAQKILRYGNDFLDDCLGGIIPSDLIVLGAKTGAGKTQLATSAALHNARFGGADGKGVPVHYFALEAEENEIERRIKYGMLSHQYYSEVSLEQQHQQQYISYTDWRQGKLEKVLGPIEERLQDQLQERVRNLRTLYRTSGDFNLKALERNLLDVVLDSRLIVIDHLHYVDTSDSDDENRAYKKVIKLVRDIVLHYRVPVMVIAHLRKSQGGKKEATSLLPQIEEFHGTSDVPKIATTAIMLGAAYDQVAPQPHLWPTYMAAVKSRLDGSRTRFAGLVHFNSHTASYDEGYRMSLASGLFYRGEFEDLDPAKNEVPRWANPTGEVITTKSID